MSFLKMDEIERRSPVSSPPGSPMFWLHILKPTYGPSEIPLMNHNKEEMIISLTRDVTCLLTAFIMVQQRQQGTLLSNTCENTKRKKDGVAWIPINGLIRGMKRSQIVVFGDDPNSTMKNEVFGDPSPGISKKLTVSYILTDGAPSSDPGDKSKENVLTRAASAEIHHATFAEHEAVILRKRSRKTENVVQSPLSKKRKHSSETSSCLLTAEMSEIALPLVMPFLGLNDRVGSRLVCRAWRDIIEDWGVATTIDSSNPSFGTFTRPFFRGILSHSHSGLHSLFLSGFSAINKSDLHPSIPHLRALRTLDISHCTELDDSTLRLLSTHCHSTLQVLYMKGVRKITDVGLLSICHACRNLRVLDVSSNMDITDRSGISIGQNLGKLRAIYMRDNHKLTNATIESITQNCQELGQLSLWGCIGITKLDFRVCQDATWTLAVLNLWGCYNLEHSNVGGALVGMKNLRSLIVSECFRLGDDFVVSVCNQVPALRHFQLRYCKLISDVAINSIARCMHRLYSLDLSFCTRPSAQAIADLLEQRKASLFELRLFHCHQLNIIGDSARTSDLTHVRETMGLAAGLILKSLRSGSATNCLCIFDARNCTGQRRQSRMDALRPSKGPFSKRMARLCFEEKSPGFFSRPVRWDSSLTQHF